MARRTFIALPFALAACAPDSDSSPAPAAEPLVFNHALAAQSIAGTGALRLLVVAEDRQGLDLDGDQDLVDFVLHILDLGRPNVAVSTLTNTGLALRSGPSSFPSPECTDALGVFVLSEVETGLDLDQDGELEASESWTFDRRTGALKGHELVPIAQAVAGDLAVFMTADDLGERALHVFDGREGRLATLPVTDPILSLLAVAEGIVAFTRSERGLLDLNADGDAADVAIVHLYDAETHRILNTGFEALGGPALIRGGFAGFIAHEALNGELDLNGDGDAEDRVFVAVGRNGLVRVLAAPEPIPAGQDEVGDLFLLSVSEEGGDRNGDGDLADRIALLYDPGSDRTVDTGLAIPGFTPFGLRRVGRWVGVPVSESDQGDLDLDGDGNAFGVVPHVVDVESGETVNLRFSGQEFLAATESQLLGLRVFPGGEAELFAWDSKAGSITFLDAHVIAVRGVAGDRALLLRSEFDRDQNGDGDVSDIVVALYDGRRHTVVDLGLAVEDAYLAENGRAAVLVSEFEQGATDLNGDGDSFDRVLHEIVLDPPRP